MNKTKNTVSLSIIFVFVFIYVAKNSNIRGTRRYFISLKIAFILLFGFSSSANAKNSGFLPGADGFTPPLSRPAPNFNNPNPALGGDRQNTGKGVSPSLNKPPRARSGFRIPHKHAKNQGFYGESTGSGGSGSGNGSENPGDDPNQNNPRFKSSDQCQDPDYFNQEQKKKKKDKKNSRQVSRKRVIEAYQNFMSKMKKKGYEINISEHRFLELCTNPQTGQFDEKSIFETTGGLELEANGMVNNLRRPDNTKVDLDFMAERVDSGETIFIDHKGMIDFGSLSDKGIDISGFPSHETVAFNMGKDSVAQKGKFIGMDQGPASIGEVVHLYNFENLRNRTETPLLMQAVLNGAEQAGYTDGIIFLNYE
jgi:hypothetical protein